MPPRLSQDGPLTESGPAPSKLDQKEKRQFGLLSTPHDAAFAGVSSRAHDLDAKLQALSGFGTRSDGTSGRKGGDAFDGGKRPSTSSQSTPGHGEGHNESSPPPALDIDFDPFDGQIKGCLYSPLSSTSPSSDSLSSQTWSQLATIRRLQAELAGAHIAMEGVGQASTVAGAEESDDEKSSARSRAGPGKRDDDKDGYGEMASRFRGREKAIHGIMEKLDALSKAVTVYHSVPIPELDLLSSRSNTTDTFDAAASPPFGDFVASPSQSLDGAVAAAAMPPVASLPAPLGRTPSQIRSSQQPPKPNVLEGSIPMVQSPQAT